MATRRYLLAILLGRHWLLGAARARPHAASFSPSLPMPTANATRLHADVKFLTSLQPARNYQNLASLNTAADYIYAELAKLGGPVQEQKYRVESHEYRTIIASFGPATAERIIVGAHYDVCGDQPGADDNASAVAGLLETARLLHAQAPSLTRRIDFVAFSLEEPPFFATEHMGSAVHAQSLHAAKVPVRAMICYEMIGYFRNEPGSQRFPDPALAKRYPSTNDTSFLRNPNYHQPTDTIDTLDFRRLAEVVNGVYGALLAL
jgi:hypothetical protein